MKRKIIAMILSLAVVLGMCIVPAFADDAEPDQQDQTVSQEEAAGGGENKDTETTDGQSGTVGDVSGETGSETTDETGTETTDDTGSDEPGTADPDENVETDPDEPGTTDPDATEPTDEDPSNIPPEAGQEPGTSAPEVTDEPDTEKTDETDTEKTDEPGTDIPDVPSAAPLFGDVNADGKVNTRDVIALLKHITGETVKVDENALDINGDGKVNTRDVITLLKYITGEDINKTGTDEDKNGNTPEDVVKQYCEAIKNNDVETINALTYIEAEPDDDTGEDAEDTDIDIPDIPDVEDPSAADGISSAFEDLYKEWLLKLEYETVKTETEGDESKVWVDFKYVDASEIMRTALQKYFERLVALSVSGKEIEPDQFAAVLSEELAAAVDSVEPGDAEATAVFELDRIDDEWKVTNISDEMLNILTSNISGVMEELMESFNFDELFGGDDSYEQTEYEGEEAKVLEAVKENCSWYDQFIEDRWPDGMTNSDGCDWSIYTEGESDGTWIAELYIFDEENTETVYQAAVRLMDGEYIVVDEQFEEGFPG